MFFLIFCMLNLNLVNWFYMGGLFFIISFFLIFCMLNLNLVNWFYMGGLFFIISFFFLILNLMMILLFLELSFMLMALLVLYYGDYFTKMTSINYFMMYTIISSIPLYSLVVIMMKLNMNNLLMWPLWDYNFNISTILFLSIPFLVKMPIFPLHVWLPKVHVMAPLFSSMVLASLMLKMGMWGMMLLTMVFDFYNLSIIMMILSMLSFIPLMKSNDFKVFIAYSSVFHMSITFTSLISLIYSAMFSGLLFSLIHCFLSPYMFFIAFVFYLLYFSRSMMISGSSFLMSVFIYIIFFLNINIPPTPSFFSEIFLFSGLFILYKWNFLFMLFLMFFFTMLSYSFWMLKVFGFNNKFKVIMAMKNYFFLFSFMMPILFMYCVL